MTAACVGSRDSFEAVRPGWGTRPCVPTPGAWRESPCVDWGKVSWAVVSAWLEWGIWMRRFTALFQRTSAQEWQRQCTHKIISEFFKDCCTKKGLKEIYPSSSEGTYFWNYQWAVLTTNPVGCIYELLLSASNLLQNGRLVMPSVETFSWGWG